MDARHTLKCDIYEFNRLRIDVIDALRFNSDVDFLYRLVTVLKIQINHEYWCECRWLTNGIKKNKWQTWQLGFQWHRRGIELVFKSLDCFTHSVFFFFFFFLGGGGGGGGCRGGGGSGGLLSFNIFTIWCCILIEVCRRLNRHPCKDRIALKFERNLGSTAADSSLVIKVIKKSKTKSRDLEASRDPVVRLPPAHLTTHLLSIGRTDWPKLHDIFKACVTNTWQRQIPVGFPVRVCDLYLLFIKIFDDVVGRMIDTRCVTKARPVFLLLICSHRTEKKLHSCWSTCAISPARFERIDRAGRHVLLQSRGPEGYW